MPRVLRVRRSRPSEDDSEPTISEVSGVSGPGIRDPGGPDRLGTRPGPRLWWSVGLSVLGSAAAATAVGSVCALTYPILRDLRVETVRGEDGTEQRMLGFWSILVLSVLAGCLCCVFTWTLTYIDSCHWSEGLVQSLAPDKHRDASVYDSYLGRGVAVLNGIMGFFTVIWSLA